ncbi:MAG: dUTP diphosphatase [Patescibacteria group bacterium]|jgi:dUTP pyrophosphatase
MQVKIKLLRPEAKLPVYSRAGDAGLDLYSCEDYILQAGERHKFGLGFILELPAGHVALIWDRGGMAANHGIHTLAGVVDSNYRGEVNAILLNTSAEPYVIKTGDRIAQLLIQEHNTVEFQEVDKLTDTERGEGAWFSSGR